MPHVISVVNQKGGVGKTTIAVHLSAALSRLGYPVLVIDLDPQGNASTTLGRQDPYEVKETIETVMLDRTTTLSPWYDTIEEDVQIIYANVKLAKVERELQRISLTSPALVLSKRIERFPLMDDHIVLIDCPPSLSLLTANALVASDCYLVPLESGSRYSLDGYQDLEELVIDVRDINPKLHCIGVVVTKHDGRRNVCKAMRSAIEREFKDVAFKTAIIQSTRIQEAEAQKKTIFQHDRKSTGARDFMSLGRELLSRLELKPIEQTREDTSEQSGVADATASEI